VLKRILVGLVVVLVAMQFVPVDRSNPPVTGEIPAPPAVAPILKRACYDCHSNETRWPWYSHVAPVSFLVARDVHAGRRHMNFSTWTAYTTTKQTRAVKDIWEQVSKGEMPMSIYVPMHPGARLTDADKAALEAWARDVAAAAPPPAPGEPLADDHDHLH
jgi:Haem-binding domain